MDKHILIIVIFLAVSVSFILLYTGGAVSLSPVDGVIKDRVNTEEQKAQKEEVTVTNFDECVDAGNTVMESYPRQCIHKDTTYTEEIDEPVQRNDGDIGRVFCTSEQRDVFCTQQYEPVCGLVNIECVTTPCNPVEETFSNACTACSNQLVESYIESQCFGGA